MAEQIPYGVATSLVDKIASAAFREIGRIYGVMEDLDNLKDTLESIKVVLSDAELRQGQEDTVAHWVRRFRQVLHHADDLLDDVFIQDLRRKAKGGTRKMSKVCGFFSISHNPIAFRANLARKIKNIRKEFNGVAEDMSKLNLNRSLIILKQDESAWRETSSAVLQSEIIGREENKSDILNLLKQNHPNQNVSLVVVVGMGGLGKTALAQLVYNDAQEQNMFQKYMWVCVSDDFEVKTVLKKMLESLKKVAGGDSLEALQQKVREEQNGQKYMLVLDDVWNEDHLKWSDLRTHLMCGGQGSKISIPYTLKGLTEEQSWTLLRNLTFGEDYSMLSPELQLIGKKIASRCGGVPLAIKTLGGFLRTTNGDIDQWSSILNGDIWELCKEKQSIVPVLELSYRKLPLQLRQCFAYCCLYPKDSVIQKDELIQLWMAQGYLSSSNETQSLEDVGNHYVKILMMRSFLQDTSMDRFGHIESFKMHDLIHDLAMSVARNDCYLDTQGKGIAGKPIHLAFETRTNCSSDVFHVCKLRTIIHGNMATELLRFTEKLKYLRALDVSSSSVTQLPKSIDKVKYLRYLDLSSSDLSSLPESVGNLVCLQTLKLNWCSNLVSLPKAVGNLVCLHTLELTRCSTLLSLPESVGNLVCLQTLNLEGCQKLVFPVEVITKLINLRELNIEGCKAFEEMMPVGLGKLTSLQCLSKFVVGDYEKRTTGRLNELKELKNIGGSFCISKLGRVGDVASESQEANLISKRHIQVLRLSWGAELYDSGEYEIKNSDSLMLLDNLCPHQNLRSLFVYGFPGVKFSDWLISLTNIVTIRFYHLPNCEHLPPLETLTCLRELRIDDMGKLERLGDDKAGNENEIHVCVPPFPRLSFLQIRDCPKLTYMPPFPHVQELVLRSCKLKPILETSMIKHETCSFSPLSALKCLCLCEVRDIEAIAEDWMKNLTSLQTLSLFGSSTVEVVLRQLQHLPSQLQDLCITHDDDNLNLWKDEDCKCGGPPRALSSLQKITFSQCDNMKALPDQIGDLQSLRHLEIFRCPKVEDRSKIAHIPNIHIE